jgi:hypothetical protein
MLHRIKSGVKLLREKRQLLRGQCEYTRPEMRCCKGTILNTWQGGTQYSVCGSEEQK